MSKWDAYDCVNLTSEQLEERADCEHTPDSDRVKILLELHRRQRHVIQALSDKLDLALQEMGKRNAN